jgi:hypothetical protein
MTLDEARQTIRDQSATYARQAEAVAVIAASKRSELSDLIRCLRLGGHPAEIAAMALYTERGAPMAATSPSSAQIPRSGRNICRANLI